MNWFPSEELISGNGEIVLEDSEEFETGSSTHKKTMTKSFFEMEKGKRARDNGKISENEMSSEKRKWADEHCR